jgi:DNA polymerase-3 subunit delta
MLHIYYGPDTYSRAEAVAALKAELDADGMLAVNTTQFDAVHLDLGALIAACDTVPFLSAHRLVIVFDYLAQAQERGRRGRALRRARASDGDPSSAEALVSYIPRMPSTTTLLLVDGPLTGESPELRALAPMAEVRHFPLLNEQAALAWIAGRVRALGVSIEPAGARLLAQTLHADLWALSSELEKLSLYATDGMIRAADVREMVPFVQESNVFAMADAIAAGRLEQALAQLRLLLDNGAAGPYLLTMMARQVRQLIVAQDLIASGAAPVVVAEKAEVRSEPALRRVIQHARRLGAARLQQAFERILEADLAIKSGELDEGPALELLVADLARLLQA